PGRPRREAGPGPRGARLPGPGLPGHLRLGGAAGAVLPLYEPERGLQPDRRGRPQAGVRRDPEPDRAAGALAEGVCPVVQATRQRVTPRGTAVPKPGTRVTVVRGPAALPDIVSS